MAAVVTYTLNAHREERYFLRIKLEKLYTAVDEYTISLSTEFLPYFKVMKQEIEFNDALDMTIEKGKTKEKKYYQTLFTLIPIYFQNLQPKFDEILQHREILNSIINEFKKSYKSGNPNGSKWIPPLSTELQKLEKISNELKTQIIKESHIVNLSVVLKLKNYITKKLS